MLRIVLEANIIKLKRLGVSIKLLLCKNKTPYNVRNKTKSVFSLSCGFGELPNAFVHTNAILVLLATEKDKT